MTACVKRSTSGAYWSIFTTTALLVSHRIVTNVESNGAALRKVTLDLGNSGVGGADLGSTRFRNGLMKVGGVGVGCKSFMMSIKGSYIWGFCKFGLEAESQQLLDTSEGADLKDATNLVEIQPPGCNHFFVIPRMELSGEHVPLASLDDVSLDIGHRPEIEYSVSNSTDVCVTSSTHTVNRSIAFRTDGPG